ncbi:MAG: PocR ligand-binding domain-containing protein [Eubacteriales bacterium]|nr:PocR ligand-binding domain-containing protein [Eubacteriales bacterium]
MKYIARMLESFRAATGIDAAFVDNDGNPLIETENSASGCRFCSLIGASPAGAEACRTWKKRASATAAQLGETYISRCHAGMVCLTMAIFCDEKPIGSLVCGPMSMWEWDEVAEKETGDYIASLPVEKKAALAEAAKLKRYDSKTVKGASDLLFAVAAQAAVNSEQQIRYARELNRQQAILAELVRRHKEGPETEDASPRDTERDLIEKVCAGDYSGAREILNTMMGEIFFNLDGDLNMIKIRLTELIIILSRAAAEEGVDADSLLMMTGKFIRTAETTSSYEKLCRNVVEAMDAFIMCVHDSGNRRRGDCVSRCEKIIDTRFREPLTLSAVAEQLYVSPYYLSHVFKEKTGVNFIDYLVEKRLREACWMLRNTSVSVSNISASVGYENPGYFSRLFKKKKGVTPEQYRKNSKKKQ